MVRRRNGKLWLFHIIQRGLFLLRETDGIRVCMCSHHHPVFLSPCVRLLCWRTSSIPSNHRCKRLACVRYFFFWFLFWPLTHETLLFNDPEPSSSTGRASEPDWVLGAFTPTNLQSTCNTIFREESLCFFPFFYFPPFFKKRSVGGGGEAELEKMGDDEWSITRMHVVDVICRAKSLERSSIRG